MTELLLPECDERYLSSIDTQGGDFGDLYPDVCVEGLEKDPF